ncbi:hypothetical protein GBAR_LOCUS24694 [Geodia barretti]|uniref:Uncharacterized protein n=1 Tax=Geodia barretti TaxID=519541 RepID=A0AA35TA64_GEOBA|nr:hypothetical protein GBAR_LOCUS24694 [Geodia barretti]
MGVWQEGEESASRLTRTACGARLGQPIATSATPQQRRTQTIPLPPPDSNLATPRNESFSPLLTRVFLHSPVIVYIVHLLHCHQHFWHHLDCILRTMYVPMSLAFHSVRACCSLHTAATVHS